MLACHYLKTKEQKTQHHIHTKNPEEGDLPYVIEKLKKCGCIQGKPTAVYTQGLKSPDWAQQSYIYKITDKKNVK